MRRISVPATAGAAAAPPPPPPAAPQPAPRAHGQLVLRPLEPFSGVLRMETQLAGLLAQLEPALPPQDATKLANRLHARVRPLRGLTPSDARLEALKQDYWYLQRAAAKSAPAAQEVAGSLRALLTTAHSVLQAVAPAQQ
jgi:hypothetical protein